MAVTRKYLTISASSDDDLRRRFLAAAKGEPQGEWLTFASPELLWSARTAERWTILEAMVESGPCSAKTIANRLEREEGTVATDPKPLFEAGVVEAGDDKYVFGYDGVHGDFVVAAA